MPTPSRGVDARVVVGLGLLVVGILISFGAFQQVANAGPTSFGSEAPSNDFGFFGGALSVIGLGLLAWWGMGWQARYNVRAAHSELVAVVREGASQVKEMRTCRGCSTSNPLDAKHCKECGAGLTS